jgi:hypothetical protein
MIITYKNQLKKFSFRKTFGRLFCRYIITDSNHYKFFKI